jgi:hypothetical protein
MMQTPPGNSDFIDDFVANAIPYPAVTTTNAALIRANVMINDREVMLRHVLFAEDGNSYEIGRSIRPAIYGEVRHGILLERSPVAEVYRRTKTEVAIKIILRVFYLFYSP